MKPERTPKEKAIELFNKFIEKWCKDNFPHLIDTDENDGEDFRIALNDLFSKAEKQGYRKGTKQFAVEFMKSQEYSDYIFEAEQRGAEQKVKEFENILNERINERTETFMECFPNATKEGIDLQIEELREILQHFKEVKK